MSIEGVFIEAEARCDCGKNPHEKTCAYYFKAPSPSTEWEQEYEEKFGALRFRGNPKAAIKAFIAEQMEKEKAKYANFYSFRVKVDSSLPNNVLVLENGRERIEFRLAARSSNKKS
jgi:hypothetical protein